MVLVHGASGRPTEQFRAFLPAAIEHDIPLLVPHFERPAYAGFQRLAGKEGKLAAAEALHRTVAHYTPSVAMTASQVDLVGFSGGAQFAHRYAMLYPERVRRLVVAAAGWYTIPDTTRRFPHGTNTQSLTGRESVDTEAFLRIPIRVMVGERDTERDELLRTGDRIDTEQGRHRLARALRWATRLRVEAAARGIAADIKFELLPDTGHSFAEALERGDFCGRVIDFLTADWHGDKGMEHGTTRAAQGLVH